MNMTFPPGRSTWCNPDSTGPTSRPAAKIGGHKCCRDADLCNHKLEPKIFDYSNDPRIMLEEGVDFYYYFFFFCFNF